MDSASRKAERDAQTLEPLAMYKWAKTQLRTSNTLKPMELSAWLALVEGAQMAKEKIYMIYPAGLDNPMDALNMVIVHGSHSTHGIYVTIARVLYTKTHYTLVPGNWTYSDTFSVGKLNNSLSNAVVGLLPRNLRPPQVAKALSMRRHFPKDSGTAK